MPDELTIPDINLAPSPEPAALQSISREWSALAAPHAELGAVNVRLREVEAALRERERLPLFGHDFIALARSVNLNNAEQPGLKRAMNKLTVRAFIE